MPPDKKKLCFVLMPFKEEMKAVYDDAIKPAIEQAGFASLRVDELKGSFNINRKIIEYIFTSDAILADLTSWNPNVFYEMGVGHAIGNKTIMIIQKKNELPFDVKTYRVIQYEQTKPGLERLKSHIVDHLECIDDWCKEPTNPVQDFKPYDAFIPQSELTALQYQLREKDELLRKSIARQKYDEKLKELEALKNELHLLKGQVVETQTEHKESQKQLKLIQKGRDEALAQVEQLNKRIAQLETELQQAKNLIPAKESKTFKQKAAAPIFRSQPATLSSDQVKSMLKKNNFYCKEASWSKEFCNPSGNGFKHQFEAKTIKGEEVVFDAASDLMWQQSGSARIDYDAAKKYVDELNNKGFAGFTDWRLPTLEEAMSLMEREKKNGDLYVDPVFDKTQHWIWTSDTVQGAAGQWVVYFYLGDCHLGDLDYYGGYVRAVRFGQSSP
ncbi:DUF1566 domain-containing protein [candidate division KSB1 bacterium]|nr:MAG: DUF1566 domain-containing protein [candidate division KSB1 bacterium]